MSTTLVMTLIVVAISVGITIWAARRTRTTVDFYAAGRKIGPLQNGLAISGDYLSAASFLGIAGLIAFAGYDGFMYSVGFLVAYLTVLLLLAEPIRNTGKYTMADVISFRTWPPAVRSAAAVSTIGVSGFYMIAQMVGAGSLVKLLIPQLDKSFFGLNPGLNSCPIPGTTGGCTSIVTVGALMVGYVVFGGMIATTYVQIVKAILLMAGTIVLSFLVLAHWGFNFGAFYDAIAQVMDKKSGLNFTQPGIQYVAGKHWVLGGFDFGVDKAAVENISLGLALIFGTAGLPHILMRFYTVPTARAARSSVGWAVGIIGVFYLLTTFLGFGAAVLVGKAHIGTLNAKGVLVANSNLAAPKLAEFLGNDYFGTFGGELFLAFISAVAFATILAVVAGLTLAASSAFAHDFWLNVVRRGRESEREQVLVARIFALVVGLVAIVVAARVPTANATVLVGIAFAIASSGNFPVLLLTLIWRRFNTVGAVAGLLGGTLLSIYLVLIGPGLTTVPVKNPMFTLQNPGLISIPFGFLCAIVGTYVGSALRRGDSAQHNAKFAELEVRAQTGIGAEGAAAPALVGGD